MFEKQQNLIWKTCHRWRDLCCSLLLGLILIEVCLFDVLSEIPIEKRWVFICNQFNLWVFLFVPYFLELIRSFCRKIRKKKKGRKKRIKGKEEEKEEGIRKKVNRKERRKNKGNKKKNKNTMKKKERKWRKKNKKKAVKESR